MPLACLAAGLNRTLKETSQWLVCYSNNKIFLEHAKKLQYIITYISQHFFFLEQAQNLQYDNSTARSTMTVMTKKQLSRVEKGKEGRTRGA